MSFKQVTLKGMKVNTYLHVLQSVLILGLNKLYLKILSHTKLVLFKT